MPRTRSVGAPVVSRSNAFRNCRTLSSSSYAGCTLYREVGVDGTERSDAVLSPASDARASAALLANCVGRAVVAVVVDALDVRERSLGSVSAACCCGSSYNA